MVPILYNVAVGDVPALLRSAKAIDLNAVNDYLSEVAARVRGESR
jgi:hypothetical protein